MKKIKSALLNSVAILVVAFCMISCGKKSEQVKFIPKDANLVVTVDVKSVGIKIVDFKQIFSLDLFSKIFSDEAKDSTMEKIKNPGIDPLSTAFVFGQINEDQNGYTALTVALSDADKFENFIKGVGQNFQVVSEGDFKFASKPGDTRTIIGWNKSSAIALYQSGSESGKTKEKVLSLFNLKKDESLIESNKNFQNLQKETADISFWVNLERLGQLAAMYNPTSSKMNLTETFLTAVCNFENGQILVDTKYHVNKETAEKLSLTKESLSKEIAAALPGKTVVSMLGISLDMDKLYTYLEKEGMIAGIEDGAKQTTGLSSKEAFQIFSGEFAGTVNGVQMKDVESMDWMTNEMVTRKEPRPEFAVVIGIKNKENAAKLLAKYTEMQMLVKTDNIYSFRNEYFLVDKGSYLAIIGPESMKQSAIDGSGDKLSTELNDMLTKNSGAFYIGFNNIPTAILDLMGPKATNYLKSSQLESFSMTSTSIKDNVSTGKIVIAFKLKEENSLITLAKFYNIVAEEEAKEAENAMLPENMEVNPDSIMVDSTSVIDESVQ